FIIFVAILLFGVDQIPEIAMVLGKSIYKIRYSINKIKKEMFEYYEKEMFEYYSKEEFSKKFKKEKKELDDNFSGSIKRT
ncbi:MAG: twin-arginine translocase TatA/TatE family subunit, partial [Flavobacteriia bacterium]|nr:twin-arginine translocase TatA/TatE family subunit [Candidatus Bostrichicola ureolyticus]